MRRPLLHGILFATLAAAAACGSDDPPPTQPTPPPVATTETYTGVLTVNGAITFAPITIGMAGSANVTIKGLLPQLTLRTGAGSGTYVVGETVYIGDTLDAAVGTATVHGWDPALGALLLNNLVGILPLNAAVIGVTSGASWLNQDVNSTLVGMALGTWSGSTCTVELVSDIAGLGSVLSGVVQGPGALCARVYDVGRILSPVEFTIEVVHF